MSTTFQRAGQLGINYIPTGQGSKSSGSYDRVGGGDGAPHEDTTSRSRMAASGARHIASSSVENQHFHSQIDDEYAIDSYTIQPLSHEARAPLGGSGSGGGGGAGSSSAYGGGGTGSGTGSAMSSSAAGDTTAGRRGGRRAHPTGMGSSASTPSFPPGPHGPQQGAGDEDWDGDDERGTRRSAIASSSSAAAPTAAELRKRQLELEVKRLELELLGKVSDHSGAEAEAEAEAAEAAAGGNSQFFGGSSSSSYSNTGNAKRSDTSAASTAKYAPGSTEDKSRQALEEALAVMQMQNKMLARRIEENEKDAQRALEEEVQRRTQAALAVAERKAESEKKELMELERGKRLLMISQLEDEAAAKLSRELEDKESLEQERHKLQAKLRQMELAEQRREAEKVEELQRQGEERERREAEQVLREERLRLELEENKRRLMTEIVAAEQEKAKAAMQAEIERLEGEYHASMEQQRERARRDQEDQERLASAKLEQETSRVRTELTSQHIRENERLVQLQEASQKQLEAERDDMRSAARRMEQEKEKLLEHMRQSEEKAREELVLAELTKSEYLSNVQRLEKEQKSLQIKMRDLDAKKAAAAAAAADTNDTGESGASQKGSVSEDRRALEEAFKQLEAEKAKVAQTLTETEMEAKRNQNQLAQQIADEKQAVATKFRQMELEKDEMATHLAATLKESQAQTRVIEEKMQAEKDALLRVMDQREQEKLDVLLKLQQTQTQMEVERIERELLKRTKEEISAAAAEVAEAEAKGSVPASDAGKGRGSSAAPAESKALLNSPRGAAAKDYSRDENAQSKDVSAKAGQGFTPGQTVLSIGSSSEAKLADIDAESAAHKATADLLARERELLREQLQQFAKEKEEFLEKLALNERTAKARQELAMQHSNREKEELKAAVHRMREELKAEKAALAQAAAELAASPSKALQDGAVPSLGIADRASRGLEDGDQPAVLKPSKSLFNMFEDGSGGSDERPLQLPRTLSKLLVQAMPHTIEAIPEGEEGATDVFGIDSDEESQALSRHGSGASLGSRIRREKKASEAKTNAVAQEVAAAKNTAWNAGAASSTSTQAAEPEPAPSPSPAPANPFEDLPAPHAAAAGGDMTRLKVLGKLELSLLSSFDGAQRCPLFYAVAYGQVEVTAYLLELAPDMVDSVDSHGDTPVHAAASGGNVDCLRALLECKQQRSKERARQQWERQMSAEGKDSSLQAYDSHYDSHKDKEVADPRNAMQMTPSHLARTPDVLEVLYGFGADMSSMDANGRSPLFIACAMNRESCTEYIIQCLDRECKTEELYEKDNRGDTPLHAAACNGSVECLLLLLQFGVDPTVSNTKGLKAIDLAARNNQSKCRNILAEYHLHYCTSSEFDSVLFLATLEGHRQVKAAEGQGSDGYEIIKKKMSFNGSAGLSPDQAKGGGGSLKHVQSMFSLKANKSLRLMRYGEWIAYEDQQTDKVYWYNSVTSTGQWEKPTAVARMQMDSAIGAGAGAGAGSGSGSGSPGSRQLTSKKSMRLKKYGDWIEYVTDTSQTFFYNEKNGEFQWHAPQGHPKYKGDAASEAAGAANEALSVAAAMLGGGSPARGTTNHAKNDPGDAGATDAYTDASGESGNGNGKGGGENNEWQPYKDPDSGSIFWYNTVTHVSQWDCPFDDVDFTGQGQGQGQGQGGHSADQGQGAGQGAGSHAGGGGERHDSDDDADAQEILDADDLGI